MDVILSALHPALVHFPVAFIYLLFICDVLYACRKSLFYQRAGYYLVIAIWITLLPTFITGLIAGEGLKESIIGDHRLWGIILFIFMSFYALFRLCVAHTHLRLSVAKCVLSFLLVIMATITANLGGMVSHGETVYSLLKEQFQENN